MPGTKVFIIAYIFVYCFNGNDCRLKSIFTSDLRHYFVQLNILLPNSVIFNSADSSYAVHLVQRCEVLKKFINWMALETLPVQVRKLFCVNFAFATQIYPSIVASSLYWKYCKRTLVCFIYLSFPGWPHSPEAWVPRLSTHLRAARGTQSAWWHSEQLVYFRHREFPLHRVQ